MQRTTFFGNEGIKPAFCVLLTTFAMLATGMANEADLTKRNLPKLQIREAIDKAEAFIKVEKLDLKGKFLARVQYHETGPWTEPHQNEKTAGPYWQVTYEPDIRADGGQIFVLVYMDGSLRYVEGR